jgi:hypothetical protein
MGQLRSLSWAEEQQPFLFSMNKDSKYRDES